MLIDTRKGFRISGGTRVVCANKDLPWDKDNLRDYTTKKINDFSAEDVIVDPWGCIPSAVGPNDSPEHDITCGSSMAKKRIYVFKREQWLMFVPEAYVAVMV